MPKAWKIAPGKGASHWDLCREKECILLGWREIKDYSVHDDEEAVLRELQKKIGKNVKGASRGAAEMIWQFFDKVALGDIVVASKGYRRIKGIGVVEGGYISPGAHNHPAPNKMLPHARKITWHITDEVLMRDHFFVQRTLAPLSLDRCDEIKAKYAKRHPGVSAKLNKLFAKLSEHATPMEAVDIVEPPTKVQVAVSRIVRDTATAKAVKQLHKHRCQICNKRIELADGEYYSEAHHIQPLGGKHKGLDVPGNILCVCPNHHAELDFGARKLVRSQLYNVDDHVVEKEYIKYHNYEVYRA